MSTTLGLYATPPTEIGAPASAPAVAWQFSDWKIVASKLEVDIHIYGLSFEMTPTGSADFTTEFLIEIGIGNPANAQTIIQFPISVRPDTAVGHYFTPKGNLFLPEQRTVREANTVCVRAANNQYGSVAGTAILNSIKILYMATRQIAPPSVTNALNMENYKGVSAASGISVGEKVR